MGALARITITWPLLAALLIVLSGISCGGDDDAAPATSQTTASPTPSGPSATRHLTSLDLPVRVAMTLPIFEDFARVAAGDHAEVFSLVPVGEDPETYQLTSDDIERLEGVFFFYYNARGLDGHLAEIIETNRDERSFVIPFAPNVMSPTMRGLTAEQAMDEAHLWLDPDLAAIYVAIVADEFVIYDEVNREYYDERYFSERARLSVFADELAAEIAAAASEEERRLLAYSDALTHFARRFDIEIAATAQPAEGETEAELIQRLVDIVESDRIPGVIAEYGHDDSVLQAVADQTGVPLCTVYTDIADPEVLDYDQMMRANVAEVIRCLSG